MSFLRNLTVLVFLLMAASACKKEEVVPQTGNLVLRFKYSSNLSGTTYSLFTEPVWTSSGRFATPLRVGVLPALAPNASSGDAAVEIKDLNAGNYVFVVGNNNSWSVQVTAGKTTEVNK
ncbi:hypothetical protein [Hymenobacter sp.]|uniref:hypothetical protein n=1 Tax=Hymenobacter sp. TaxID=1898978 RepID=UPI00286BAECA|nr:hypothetical protein [Hymenobacter sp.]